MRRIVVGLIASALFATTGTVNSAGATSSGVPDPPTNVKFFRQYSDHTCVGDHDRITWTPPANTGGEPLTGYVIRQEYRDNTMHVDTQVGPDATKAIVTPLFGLVTFAIYAVNANGPSESVAAGLVVAQTTPGDLIYQGVPGQSVGDHTATAVPSWPNPSDPISTGGRLDNTTITLTQSPGGVTFTYPATEWSTGHTFTRLTNGVHYAFGAVATSPCGSSSPSGGGSWTPGVAPTFVRNHPPLSMASGTRYRYWFHGTGKPGATYRLSADAPAWLRIDSLSGVVSGRPPDGTASFSYSVFAHNGVGWAIQPGAGGADTVTGPFTVSIA